MIWAIVELTVCLAPVLLSAHSMPESFVPPQVPASVADVLQANPSRPSNSHSAELLSPGLLQAEYGWLRQWQPLGPQQSAVGGELRFGVSRNFEFRWGANFFVANSFGPGQGGGFGDQYFTGEYHFKNQSARFPAWAASYSIKLPAASLTQELGSGRIDHFFTVLASKQIRKFTADLNLACQLIGRPGTTGRDQNELVILTLSSPAVGPLTAVAEIDANTRLNAQVPAFATTLVALSWKVQRRLVLDAGLQTGITQGSPHKRVSFGFTYAIANLYAKR